TDIGPLGGPPADRAAGECSAFPILVRRSPCARRSAHPPPAFRTPSAPCCAIRRASRRARALMAIASPRPARPMRSRAAETRRAAGTSSKWYPPKSKVALPIIPQLGDAGKEERLMYSSGNITVYVSNMDRAVRFYSEVLGLRLAYRFGDHW